MTSLDPRSYISNNMLRPPVGRLTTPSLIPLSYQPRYSSCERFDFSLELERLWV